MIIKDILDQARVFLTDAGEFYPFASVITGNGQLRQVGIYFGEEYPDSLTVLERLEDALIKGLAAKIIEWQQ